MLIGDALSDEGKEAFIRSRLVPGAVIYRHCDFTTPPKPKFLVVANVRQETAVLIINSEINQFIQKNKHMLDCQVSIDAGSHQFLAYDSFVDCTGAEYIDTSQLITELMADLQRLKGHISTAVKADVIKAISESYTISTAEINLLVTSLSS